MESAVVVTSVHKEETTQQISQNNSGTEQDFERGFSRFLERVDNSDFLDSSYRSGRLMEYYDLVAILDFVLSESDLKYCTNMLERFQKCRTMAWQYLDPETWLIKSQSNSCRLRWCPMCAEAHVNIIAHNCFEFLSKQKDVRFLTLTMKHSDLPLSEQIRLMKKCFIKLGRRVGWKKYVTGSIPFLHVKRNPDNTEWHVHLHIILTGSYVPQEWLSSEWLKVTGDSIIVHIKAAHTEKELGLTIKDFTRYAGCPANLLKIPIEHQLEVVHAFEGIRVCWTTGICGAVSLSPPKYNKDDSKLINLGRDSTIRRRAAAGDLNALRILYCSDRGVPFENAPSFRDDDDGGAGNNCSAGFLSPVEPLPSNLFSANERAPPGVGAFQNEGDVAAENAPW